MESNPLSPHVHDSGRTDHWVIAGASTPVSSTPQHSKKVKGENSTGRHVGRDTKCVRFPKPVLSDTLNAEEEYASLSPTQSKRNREEGRR